MAKFLIKTTDVYRVDTISEVEAFHTDLKSNNSFELASFAYQQKQVIKKGEILDEYCLVTIKKVFNDAKEPNSDIDISYCREVDFE